MATISYVQACQPETMLDFGAHLVAQNSILVNRIDQMHREVDGAKTRWKGDGASAMAASELAKQLAGSHIGSAVVAVADAYNDFGKQLSAIRTPLLTIATIEVPGAGMTVDDHGVVTAPPVPYADVDPGSYINQLNLNKQAAALQARIQALLNDFSAMETEAAQAITADLEQLAALQQAPDPILGEAVKAILAGTAQLPTDPQQLRDFWEKLTPAEKDALFRHDPFIGNRDGIPQVDRDYYNRRNLNNLHAKAQSQLDNLNQRLELTLTPAQRAGLQAQADSLADRIAGYKKLSEALVPTDGVPRLLSLFDDKGRAAIAIRNPDTAGNVVTFVPGTGANVEEMKAVTDRADMLRIAAEGADHTTRTSAIGWLGYDVPQWPGSAALDDGAEDATDRLNNYQSGLRVTHEGPRSMNTVVGHSYGTTAIGHAASAADRPLDADKLIFAGSPGVGVEAPSEIRLTGVGAEDSSKRIYSTIAPEDTTAPIAASTGLHGTAPWMPGFGTNFASDEGTDHNTYFGHENQKGLETMGHIISDKEQTR
ncbi:alpha/beta hydrolase [Nocardia iowensis]|uniref:Alpha/beta hydrolase family protein n=1 Tax=Nocardia iowensis TaxID=204891 RepID=A0ABX8RG39_NOCIO|nr:alpha/beta hydrolase [Nocardia iowensis]QXN88558.1 alpha/beta hydrolase family protein [Nocardia iowensis]